MTTTISYPAPSTTFKALNDPYVLLFSAFIILDFIYTVGFNMMPNDLRLRFAGALFSGQAAFALGSLAFRLHPWRLKAVFVLLVLLLSWIASGVFLGTPSTGVDIIRTLAPFLFGLWVLGYPDRLPVRLILVLACSTLLFALAWGLVNPSFYWKDESLARFAPFHGGIFGKGASAMVILCCVMIVHQIMLAGRVRPSIAWPFIGVGMVDLVGYWVTGVQLSMLGYFGTHYLFSARLKTSVKVLMCALFAIAVTATIVEKEVRNLEYRGASSLAVVNMGSGRVGTWISRVDLIVNRDLPTILFGSGLMSDDFISPTWAYKTTTSHQVFLTYIIEGGVVGTIAFIAFIIMIVRLLGPPGYSIFAALLVGSILGNSVPLKPMPFVLFWLAAGVVAVRLTQPVPTTGRPAYSDGSTSTGYGCATQIS